jgi:hypothetical protein
MPDEPTLEEMLKELLRNLKTPRLPPRLPDTGETRRALVQARDLHRYQPRQCSRCDRSFLVRGHSASYCNVSYCSRECQQADRNERRAKQREQERQRHPCKTITCLVCKETFAPRRNDAITCSSKCRQKLYRERAAHGMTFKDNKRTQRGQRCARAASQNNKPMNTGSGNT